MPLAQPNRVLVNVLPLPDGAGSAGGPFELVPYDLDARGKGGRNFHKCFVRQVADFYCEELRPDACPSNQSASGAYGHGRMWEITAKFNEAVFPESIFFGLFCEHLQRLPQEFMDQPLWPAV